MKLDEIKGIGPKTLKTLNNNNIYTLNNLIEYYPYTFKEYKYSESLEQDNLIIKGIIEGNPIINFYNKKMNKMTFKVNAFNRLINVFIFNRAFLKNNLKPGMVVTLIGKYEFKNNTFTCSDILLKELPVNGLIKPIYHSLGDLTSTKISNLILNCLNYIKPVEYVPDYLKEKYHLACKNKSIYEVHKPTNMQNLKNSLNYLKYEEVFLFMLKMNYLKNNKDKKIGIKREVNYKLVNDFIKTLPFTLTDSQLECVDDIYKDLMSDKKMNRLLQGDVSSGKTIVAIISLYINYLSKHQGVFMAPTEILARQHYSNLINYFANTDVNVALLTGKLKVKERREVLNKLANGEIDIIVGTHALFSEDVIYNNLGLVITDEQHRFGVNQRSSLNNKGNNPDVLYISATPIPRTYAIVLYGDMDISSIKTMPRSERKITTLLKKNKEIKDVLDMVYQELKLNHQIYVVAPLIEDSEDDTTLSVVKLKEQFDKAFSKIANIGILHGKMINEEKEKVMEQYKNNEINILISTTVIEVGVDIKNATMMIVFDSYRFGLSQLHQLRGRIGRNDLYNYCVLISDHETERLNILTKTLDGFKIAEEDFKIRGGGDIFGIRQSGQIGFNLTDEVKDFNILMRASEDSARFLQDNNLEKQEYFPIWEILKDSLKLD